LTSSPIQPARSSIVDAVERQLLTPVGLRSLAPGEPGYPPQYQGDSSARDAVYHQGTVWPWLIGPFVEAWVLSFSGVVAWRAVAPRSRGVVRAKARHSGQKSGSAMGLKRRQLRDKQDPDTSVIAKKASRLVIRAEPLRRQ
jgi:hypothetical protein